MDHSHTEALLQLMGERPSFQPEAPLFNPDWYPYSYGYEFLREQAGPAWQQAEIQRTHLEIAGLLERYARGHGLDRRELCSLLADQYLAEHGITQTEHPQTRQERDHEAIGRELAERKLSPFKRRMLGREDTLLSRTLAGMREELVRDPELARMREELDKRPRTRPHARGTGDRTQSSPVCARNWAPSISKAGGAVSSGSRRSGRAQSRSLRPPLD